MCCKNYCQYTTCHWCGSSTRVPKFEQKHVFCCNRCKMAHWRAYNRYVTRITRQQLEANSRGNVRKQIKS